MADKKTKKSRKVKTALEQYNEANPGNIYRTGDYMTDAQNKELRDAKKEGRAPKQLKNWRRYSHGGRLSQHD